MAEGFGWDRDPRTGKLGEEGSEMGEEFANKDPD